MKVHEYDSMVSIINDLDIDDIEQLEDYATDCEMLGFVQTAKYIKCQIRAEIDIDLSIVEYKLSADYAGL